MTRHEIAEDYCRKQLIIMDGSFESGILRIGTERFDKMVRDVEAAVKQARGTNGAKEG